jgi:SSS family solute:Na+ symporter
VVVVLVIAAYVSLGGMRGSGWTDVVQGILMFTAMLLVGLFISSALGGFTAAGESAFAADPRMFVRAGGFFTPTIWLSFMVLWIFVDPMFPQLFTRFYTAKTEKSLKTSMTLYPFLISFITTPSSCPSLFSVATAWWRL